jgi:hypothetical protein
LSCLIFPGDMQIHNARHEEKVCANQGRVGKERDYLSLTLTITLTPTLIVTL